MTPPPAVPHDADPDRYRPFHHLAAEKAGLYRQVLRVFARAKASFQLHLRPREVVTALGGGDAHAIDADAIEAALTQLTHWGNLEAFADTAEVRTVEDFQRSRSIYQLTRAGEAAEHAIERFEDEIERPGELKTVALSDIHDLLIELGALAAPDDIAAIDAGKLHRTATALCHRFEELTREAQVFLGGLQRTIDLHSLEVELFVEYKERLIDYLERFVGELVRATAKISAQLFAVEAHGLDRLLTLLAERDQLDALVVTDDEHRAFVERARLQWEARWSGIRAWFIAERDPVTGVTGRSQAERLRARARAAIPSLLSALSVIHDRRTARSDRAADLVELARWFAEAPTDADAHRLWRVAFALTPTRHLKVDSESVDARHASPVSPRTSWLDAPPLRILPQLRQSGRVHRAGRPTKILDLARQRAQLASDSRRQVEATLEAARRIATGERVRLSEFPALEMAELGLLQGLLSAALGRRRHPTDTVRARSTDGSLTIVLEPIPHAPVVDLRTTHGTFRGPDHYVRLTRNSAVPS